LDVVEDSGGGSGVLYSDGTGVHPVAVAVVVSLKFVGLSPWLTDGGADADADVDMDEVGRGISAGEAVAVEVAVVVVAVAAAGGAGVCVSLILGCSKSHATPCLEQLPQRGWTSSHLIFLTLHRLQPRTCTHTY
jgi:hypothetical protein